MGSLNSLFLPHGQPNATPPPPGTSIVIAPGIYACELAHCHNAKTMLVLDEFSGTVEGGGGMRDTELDGEGKRVIINVYGSGNPSNEGDEGLTIMLLSFISGSQAVGGSL